MLGDTLMSDAAVEQHGTEQHQPDTSFAVTGKAEDATPCGPRKVAAAICGFLRKQIFVVAIACAV